MMKRITGLIMICILLAVMPAGCSATGGDAGADTGAAESTQSAEIEDSGTQEDAEASDAEDTEDNVDTEEEFSNMKMTINDTPVNVSWENNESVRALAKMAENGPVTIETEPYGDRKSTR